MSDMDIRTWAKENGHKVPARGPVPESTRTAYEQRPDAADAGGGGDVGAPDGGTPLADPGVPPSTRERQPIPPSGGAGWLNRGEKRAAKMATGGKPVHRRVSIESVVSSAWGALGGILAKNSRVLPVARMLQIQAPVAGMVVEQMARDTVVDRILQPLARLNARGESIGALIGPPILVGIITAQPALYDTLAPVLKQSLIAWMEIAGPQMEKAKKKAEKLESEFGADVDSLVAMLFAPPPEYADADGGRGDS